MANNFAARLDRLEASQRRRAKTGPKLTMPEGEPVVLHADDIAGIEAAKAAGRRVWIADERGPASPIP